MMKSRFLLLFLCSFIIAPELLLARGTYIWEESKQKPYSHYRDKFLQQVSYFATEYLRGRFEGVEYVYAAAHAFGIPNGQKLRVVDFTVHNSDRGPQGFRAPTVPRVYEDLRKKIQIDPFDYYATVYLVVSDSREEFSFPFEIGMNFMCQEDDVIKECRKTKHSQFFDYEINTSSSNLNLNNYNKDIIGIVYDWKPFIREVQLGIINRNHPVHAVNIFEEYKDRPDIIQAIRHRLVAPGMGMREVALAIGNGEGLGITPIFNKERKVEKVIYEAHKRSREILP